MRRLHASRLCIDAAVRAGVKIVDDRFMDMSPTAYVKDVL
jgi:hypothetical protein